MIYDCVMVLQHSYYFSYLIHLSLLSFVSAASFDAVLSCHIPIQKDLFLHFVSICAGILPHLIEIMDLVFQCV